MTHLVLLSLCAFRIWALLGRDDITAGLRSHLPGVVLKGVECSWCLGSWTALALVTFDHFSPLPAWLLVAGATAALVGSFGDAVERLNR